MRLPGMPPPTMPLEELRRRLTRIIETAPSLPDNGPIPLDYMKWAGDANALIVETGYFSLVPEAQVAINGLSFADRLVRREQLMMILHKARAQIELELQQSGASGPTSPAPGLNGTTGPDRTPSQGAGPFGDAKSIEDLLSPHYMKDPRTSDMDPRTSNLGFRSQPRLTGAQATGGVGQVSVLTSNRTEAKLEELAVKVALLEAAISIPKPPGVGHNRGPGLENEQEDEEEIRRLIALLKDDGAKVGNPAVLVDVAQREIQRAEQGIKLHVEFAKGLAKGAGFVVGKDIVERLAESAWWMSVYERLMDVAKALRDICL